MQIHGLAPALVLPLVLALAPTASAQASFVETFDAVGPTVGDGPSGLTAKGWIFRNQSQPKGSSGWHDGSLWLMDPFQGASFLEVDGLSTGDFGGDISTWAILPAVPGQIAGDTLALHVQRSFSHSDERLQIRYSPSGGTSTGAGFAGVGDFTQTLLDLPLVSSGWQTVAVEVPGPGRVALRYVVPDACIFGCSVPHVGFDLLSVGPPPDPGCNLPPLPQAGETVHWTAAGGPWEICADVSIPPGATVVVDPGASVAVDSGRTVTVSGTLIALGTAAQPITLSGWGSPFGGAFEVDGEAQVAFASIATELHAQTGGSIVVRDSAFHGFGVSSSPVLVGAPGGIYLEVERATVQGADLGVTDGTLVLSDVALQGGGVRVLRGWLYADDVTVDGAPIAVTRERFASPLWLDRVEVRNAPGPALDLSGWNYHVGPSAVLQQSEFPVRVNGGLMPGSQVPASGNAQNVVIANLLVGSSTWGRLAVPYVVTGFPQVGGANLEIEAGTTVELGPGAGVLFYGAAGIQARGTEQAPIAFRRRNPGQAWDRIKFLADTGHTHFEWCTFTGANVALQSDNAFLYADACTMTGNQTALWTNTFGLLTGRKLRLENNGVAAHEVSGLIDLDGFTNPSSIAGNGKGVDAGEVQARANWWGHPSGPKHPQNPAGQGDSAVGTALVLPFRTAPPDFADAPPRVELAPIRGPLHDGQKVLLSWTSSDDGDVVAHDVLFSPYGNFNYQPFLTGLAGDATSVEVVVPVVPPSSLIEPASFRVVAIDDAGQQGWDEFPVLIPYDGDQPPIAFDFTSDLSGPFTFGDRTLVEWDQSGMSGTWNLAVVSDVDEDGVGFGGGTTISDAWDVRMPYVSTDTARVWITFLLGAGNRSVTVRSQPFTIRPDPRVGDAPPAIALQSPAPGATVQAGTVVPVAWSASDDRGLQAIRVFASTDGGETWQRLAELPPTATSYGWRLPASSGLPNVRLRVAAIDLFYQSTSATIPLAISAGAGTTCAESLGFAGPGGSVLSLCGEPLASGKHATLALQNAPAGAPAWIVVSQAVTPTPLLGGTLAAFPPKIVAAAATGATGAIQVPIQGGTGPATLYAQAVVLDPAQPFGFGFSNAIAVELLP